MRFIARIAFTILGNGVGLYAAHLWVPGFTIATAWESILGLAVILALLNAIVRPVLKLLFIPIIILTLGLGIIIVNAVILFLLDFISQNLTIESIPALLWGTLIVSGVNLVFTLARKS
jgi:putative membrane protein